MLTGSVTLLIVIAWGLRILSGGRLYRDSRMKVLACMAFAFYISQLVAATLFPLPIDSALIEMQRARAAAGFGPGNNFTLFATLQDASMSDFTFANQIIGNFLLLMPLGFMAPLLFSRFASFGRAISLVVGTTLAIEFSQLAISGVLGFTYRSFDVDDLWLNALGGFVAVVAAMVVRSANAATSDPAVAAADGPAEQPATGLRETALYRSGP